MKGCGAVSSLWRWTGHRLAFTPVISPEQNYKHAGSHRSQTVTPRPHAGWLNCNSPNGGAIHAGFIPSHGTQSTWADLLELISCKAKGKPLRLDTPPLFRSDVRPNLTSKLLLSEVPGDYPAPQVIAVSVNRTCLFVRGQTSIRASKR